MPVTRLKFLKAGLILSAGALLLEALWGEQFFIETNHYYLGASTKKTKNVKIVQISDLHLHSLNYQLKRLALRINKLQPDMIAITGDAIDKARNISLLNSFLKLLDFEIQKVAILGNWEYQGRVDLVSLDKVYADNNCKLLINQNVQYLFQNKTFSITGTDDYRGGNADFDLAMEGFKKGDYHIVLTHCPTYSDYIAGRLKDETNADCILSGHTHGGQINLLGYIPFLPFGSGRYVKGWYNNNGQQLYVSKGIGTGVIPVRIGSRAEIAVFNFAT